jgi:hypothetical protein
MMDSVPKAPARWWRPRVSERRVLLLSGDLLLLSLALVLALALRSAAVLGSPYWLFGGLQLHWWLVLWAIWTPVAITVGIYAPAYCL